LCASLVDVPDATGTGPLEPRFKILSQRHRRGALFSASIKKHYKLMRPGNTCVALFIFSGRNYALLVNEI
jgi:hypothetical protein